MRLTKAPRRCGCDTAAYVDPDTAKQLLKAGYHYVLRYLRRDRHVNERPDISGGVVSLSQQELKQLLSAKMDVGLVQFFSNAKPTAKRGQLVGRNAAWNARQLGAPDGCTLWLDMEWGGSAGEQDGASALAYGNAWAAAVASEGYEAGVYIGVNSGMTGDQFYSMPNVRHYWKSASMVPWVPHRGFQLMQSLETDVAGLRIDQDLSMLDNKGDRWHLLTA
jgi:hypothetical protein